MPVQVHATNADRIFVSEGDSDAARQLANQASDAELFLHPGDQHYLADSSLPPYDADATAHLIYRMLDAARGPPGSHERLYGAMKPEQEILRPIHGAAGAIITTRLFVDRRALRFDDIPV